MADKEHLTHLRQGEAHWNTWRAEQPVDLRPDLSGAHLSGADLSGAHLNRANLSDADLRGANFSEANLSRAVVFRTIFSDLDLRNVRGLDTLVHTGPSTIGTDTLVLKVKGNLDLKLPPVSYQLVQSRFGMILRILQS